MKKFEFEALDKVEQRNVVKGIIRELRKHNYIYIGYLNRNTLPPDTLKESTALLDEQHLTIHIHIDTKNLAETFIALEKGLNLIETREQHVKHRLESPSDEVFLNTLLNTDFYH